RFLGGRGSVGLRVEDLKVKIEESGVSASLREVRHSDVQQAIVDEARKGYDIIVMGASRHGGGLGGRTLEDVVRSAPCHLAIVKAGASNEACRRVLARFDGGIFSRVAVELGVRWAELTGAVLTVVIPIELAAGLKSDGAASDDLLDRISPLFR